MREVHNKRLAKPTTEMVPVEDVERRITRGVLTLRALPDREKQWLKVRSNWPGEVVYDWSDLVAQAENKEYLKELRRNEQERFQPTQADVSDYLTALAWWTQLQARDRDIVWWHALGLSFRDIGKRINLGEQQSRSRYRNAIVQCWRIANHDAIKGAKCAAQRLFGRQRAGA